MTAHVQRHIDARGYKKRTYVDTFAINRSGRAEVVYARIVGNPVVLHNKKDFARRYGNGLIP